MTSVTFETATIADAVRRAVKIAPGKAGHAFDKAAGIFLEINPEGEGSCLIRSTNLDAFHTEIVSVVHIAGEAARWRLPSSLMGNVVGSLPPASGSQVTFTQEDRRIRINHGKMKASMMLMDEESFPDWEMFDNDNMSTVSALGGKLALVEWAANSDNVPPMCGVFLNGEYAVATDRYKLVRVPLKINLSKQVIIPSGILGSMLKTLSEALVKVEGTQLLVAPDDWTQLRLSVYDMSYFPVDRIFESKFECVVEVNKADLLEKLNRAGTYAGADRNPKLQTHWGRNQIAVVMENDEIGLIGDVVEVPGGLDHARVQMAFTPKYLIDTLNNAPEAKVRIHYSISEEGIKQPYIKIEGGGGYEAWVMKRQEARSTS